jgi:glycosyltransferase involved in cell wall biosynthesis
MALVPDWRLLYILSKSGEELEETRAGDTVRASCLLEQLSRCGCALKRVEAHHDTVTRGAARAYRTVLKKVVPLPFAQVLRDVVVPALTLRHSRVVAAQAREFGAEALIETHNAISLTGVEASRLAKLPLIVDDVTPPEETESFHSTVLGSLHRMIFGRTVNRAAALVVANDSIGDRLVSAGAPRAKILVVENGFAAEHFFPRPNRDALRTRFGLATDSFVAAFCGSFQKWHRVDMLVRAFGRAFPEGSACLLLIGDGPEFQATSRLAANCCAIEWC